MFDQTRSDLLPLHPVVVSESTSCSVQPDVQAREDGDLDHPHLDLPHLVHGARHHGRLGHLGYHPVSSLTSSDIPSTSCVHNIPPGLIFWKFRRLLVSF